MLLTRDRVDDYATNQNKRTQRQSQIESGQERRGSFIDIAVASGVNRGQKWRQQVQKFENKEQEDVEMGEVYS